MNSRPVLYRCNFFLGLVYSLVLHEKYNQETTFLVFNVPAYHRHRDYKNPAKYWNKGTHITSCRS
jgi:hypothetical protein